MNKASELELSAPFSAESIAQARLAATGREGGVTAALDELSALTPENFLARLAASFHYPVATMDDLHRWVPAFDVLPYAEAVRHQLILFRDDGAVFRLVFGDPFASDRLAWADDRIDVPFIWTLAHHADVAAYLSRHEETLSAVESLLPTAMDEAAATIGVEDLSFRSINEDASQVVKLVRSTLYDALKAEASDIHLETTPKGLAIKYRVDGVLVAIGSLPGGPLAEQVISRVKVMAELDISERRVPQDGRFKVSARGREIDFRVSIMPSIFGEDAVLRILDKQQLADEVKGLTLESIGFDIATRGVVRKLASEPYGMLLITGPTPQLCDRVRAIHAAGTTIVLVEQSVDVALLLAGRAVFLEKGEVRFEGPTADLLERPDLLRSVFIGAGRYEGHSGPNPVLTRGVRLECRGVVRRFGGLTALDGVDLDIAPGSAVGIIGHNGAGKTTLFDVISGFLVPDAGGVLLGEIDITDAPPHRRAIAGLGRSFQEARLYPSLTVAETVAVALERHLPNRDTLAAALALPASTYMEAAVADRVNDVLAMLGLTGYRNHRTADLSTGTRRIVELACVLAQDPDVLLLDEPSAGVAQRETEALAPLLRRVREATGCSLVIIEHDMGLISAVCDELVALEFGSVIARGTPAEVLAHPRVIASYLGDGGRSRDNALYV